jgi:MFS family permease
VLSLLCCVQFLLVLDVTVVNVALPELRADLLLSTAQAQWALTAYLVPFGALLLVGGRLGDRYGRRRVLVAGLLLFAVGNLLAAVSTGFAWLVLARALTGVGAAAASPSALALLVTCFPSGPAHARAFAAWGGVGAAGAAAGVLLGGLLTSWLGWRAVFAIAVPVTTLLIAAAPRLLPRALPSRPRTVDLLGALLSAAAAGACLLALGRTSELGWNAPRCTRGTRSPRLRSCCCGCTCAALATRWSTWSCCTAAPSWPARPLWPARPGRSSARSCSPRCCCRSAWGTRRCAPAWSSCRPRSLRPSRHAAPVLSWAGGAAGPSPRSD